MNDQQPRNGSDESIGYADAMKELEQILRDLEGDDLDVDMLASRVERASYVIGRCRQRISDARVQVERVVANLDRDDGAAGLGDPDRTDRGGTDGRGDLTDRDRTDGRSDRDRTDRRGDTDVRGDRTDRRGDLTDGGGELP